MLKKNYYKKYPPINCKLSPFIIVMLPPLTDQARMQIHLHLWSNILNDEDKTE